MTQPDNIPGLITELFDGFIIPFEDATAQQDGPVSITRGRADESSEVDAGQMTLVLSNLDGRYTPRNPNSPYFGSLGRNTRIRVRLEDNSAAGIRLRNPTHNVTEVDAWAYANDAASLDFTNDADVRIEITPDTWFPALPQNLILKWEPVNGSRSWVFRHGNGVLQWIWSADGLVGIATITSVALPVGLTSLIRGAVRITMDVDNGSGSRVTQFYWAESLDGPWTLFSTGTVAGVTSIFDGNARIGIGASGNGSRAFAGSTGFNGIVHAAEIRDGINGPVISNPNFREYLTILQKNADVVAGVEDDFGHVYFLEQFTEVERPDIRASMEVARWAPRWDMSGRDVAVDVEAAGILRRLGSPGRPENDAIRRFMLSVNAQNILNYWPLSDPDTAIVAASAVGGPAMKVSFRREAPLFGRGNLEFYLPASAQTGDGNGRIQGSILGGTTGGFTIDVAMRAEDPASATTNEVPVIISFDIRTADESVHTSGVSWVATVNPATNLISLAVTNVATGASLGSGSVSIGNTNILDGQMHHLRMRCTEGAGTNSNIFLDLDRVNLIGFGFNLGITTTPAPVSAGVEWSTSGAAELPWSFGQIAVFGDPPPGLFTVNDAFIGYRGEPAAERWRRLVAEEGFIPVIYGNQLDSPAMGPQQALTGLASIREAVATDGGIMFEVRDWPTLGIIPLSYLVNRDPLLVLDYALNQVAVPFHPDEDDQNIRNDVTAQQIGTDETARVVLEVGPMSIQEPPSGVGQYPEQIEASVQLPEQLNTIAGRRVLRGTWPTSRYPQLGVAIRHTAENLKLLALRDSMLVADSGRRADVVNLPTWLPPEDAQLLLQGYTEDITPEDHDIAFNSSPYGPYLPGQLPDPDHPDGEFGLNATRVDTDGSHLADDLSVGIDTSMLVATLQGPVWTTDAAEYPDGFDVVLSEGFQQADSAILRVTEIDSFAADNFNRSVADPNWGSTSTGSISWARFGTVGNVTTSVNGSRGLINRTAAGNSYMALTGLDFDNVEVIVSIDSSVATGFGGLMLRFGQPSGSDLADGYGVVINAASELLEIYRNVTGGVGSTLLGSVPIPNWTINTQWRIRARAAGTAIMANIWPISIPERTRWMLVVEDSTHTSGSIAMQRVGTGEARFDNLEITSPQIFTIEQQAINGVVRNITLNPTSTVGVRLARPTRPGG